MARKKLTRDQEAKVLTDCRRRCCICFAIDRDSLVKRGQIAHLDKDSSNNKSENLAFLCLDHHEQYDSSSRQAKGWKISEVKHYQNELFEFLGKALDVDVPYGKVKIPKADPYAGTYVQVGVPDRDAADLILTPLPKSPEGLPQYALNGTSYWFGLKDHPNMGFLDEIGVLYEGRLECFITKPDEETHIVMLTWKDDYLEVNEENWLGSYGMGANFIGKYRRMS